uniref:Ionotropic glutamate receptor C-terminal domain-containing protein n=1 Tax=Chromera velia CCMP2878 TaxID=1169474 RepID=A0A0G4H155_9ALVE|eukprot:Cvel_800.t1-p1 / transcript=Cvel_800.t1 / gene=Cvel_800 / organism=Chromera_velia_CCMP2878 / gene_product=Glutamate receptor 3.2, putative / transcript_product=Glutamate receptor 3.2, putative / location=Cvel_scaffold25:32397-39076(-) / protein_length=716 / sequence_SO=supercontig / SO=protein_coding / is_pseudo=false
MKVRIALLSLFFYSLKEGVNATTWTTPTASCAVRDALAADSTLKHADALKGRTFQVMMESSYEPYVNMAAGTGFAIDVVQELARRGGFSVSLTDGGVPQSGESWDDMLIRLASSGDYDWMGSYWKESFYRTGLGATMTWQYVDTSTTLVALKPREKEKDLFKQMSLFVEPFSGYVWLCIVGIILGAGAIHWYVDRDRREEARSAWRSFVFRKMALRKRKYQYMVREIRGELSTQNGGKSGDAEGPVGSGKEEKEKRREKERDEEDVEGLDDVKIPDGLGWTEDAAIELMDPLTRPESNISKYPRVGASIFMKAMAFGPLGPKPIPFSGLARIHLFVFSIFIFVVTAAYTANLATFLIRDAELETPILGMDDIQRRELSVCIPAADAEVSRLARTLYPRTSQFRKYATPSEGLELVRNKTCAGQLLDPGVAEGLFSENKKCDMRIVGQPLARQGGGYAFWAFNDCHAAVRPGLNNILLEMQEDGWLTRAWQEYVELPDVCRDLAATADAQESVQLTIESFSGLFVAYGFLSSVVIVLAFIHARTRKHTEYALSKATEQVKANTQRAFVRMATVQAPSNRGKNVPGSSFHVDTEKVAQHSDDVEKDGGAQTFQAARLEEELEEEEEEASPPSLSPSSEVSPVGEEDHDLRDLSPARRGPPVASLSLAAEEKGEGGREKEELHRSYDEEKPPSEANEPIGGVPSVVNGRTTTGRFGGDR